MTEQSPKPEPVKIDAAFEEEARAMARAMHDGLLPPRDKPYYARVKKVSELYWRAKNKHGVGRA